MAESVGAAFPHGINVGHVHQNNASGLSYRYLSDDPTNPLNWVVIGGTTTHDPDTTGWTVRQDGAIWYNRTENLFKAWDGTAIIIVGDASGVNDVFVFSDTQAPSIYTSWTELYAAYQKSGVSIKTIYVYNPGGSASLSIPAGTYVFTQDTRLIGITYNDNVGYPTLVFADGAAFDGLIKFTDLNLQSLSSTPIITFDPLQLLILNNTFITSIGTAAAIQIADDSFIECYNAAKLGPHALELLTGVSAFVFLYNANCTIGINALVGDGATSVFVTRHNDGQIVENPQTNFTGTLQVDLSTHRAQVTANRPVNPPIGIPYFDTTIGRPVWWNGTNWINAIGTIV